MIIRLLHNSKEHIAEIVSGNIVINSVQNALDIIGQCMYNNTVIEALIINEKNITPHFFDLKTGIAGEILQKFTLYCLKLAIIGDFSKYQSKSLSNFIYETNKTGKIIFVDTIYKAKEIFAKNNLQ